MAGSGVSDSFLAAASADRKPNEKLNYGVILQGGLFEGMLNLFLRVFFFFFGILYLSVIFFLPFFFSFSFFPDAIFCAGSSKTNTLRFVVLKKKFFLGKRLCWVRA